MRYRRRPARPNSDLYSVSGMQAEAAYTQIQTQTRTQVTRAV